MDSETNSQQFQWATEKQI